MTGMEQFGVGSGVFFSAFMSVLHQVRLKRVRSHINGTPVKVEKMRLLMIETLDAMLIPANQVNEAWRRQKLAHVRDCLSELPMLTAQQYRDSVDSD